MVQDDVLFHDREDLPAHLERTLWPGEDVAAVSLYCPRPCGRSRPGWYALDAAWVWGALAFVFPPGAASRLVTDQGVFDHRWSQRNEGKANIDVVVGQWAADHGLRVHYPSPSLVQHIGDTSTLWPRSAAVGNRRASRFPGPSPHGARDPICPTDRPRETPSSG